VERHEIIELLGQLQLAGMRAAYDEVVAAGLRAQHPFQRIFGELLLAQLADHRARSTDGSARSADPSLRYSRNRHRELALQEPHLTSRSEPLADRPRGSTAPLHARRSVAREGTARRARAPSMDSGDDRSSTAGVGSDWTLISGPASALIDSFILSAWTSA
jgi:hypothetical protein